MSDRNMFGGGNANSLYTPMSEVEQEALSRLIEANDLRVHIVGWGVVNKPRVTFGDLRLAVAFRLHFDRPEAPMPVRFFDLELRTGSGLLLFKERQSCTYGGKPLSVAAGVFLDMVWDIAIMRMDPKVVKAIVPGAIGLTSRWTDKDTGELSLLGNTKMDSKRKETLKRLRQGEATVRAGTKRAAAKASAE